MFTAIAVEEADDATGNPHSLAITSNDRNIHFVRGACREEAKGWKDVLTSYMRHTTQVSLYNFIFCYLIYIFKTNIFDEPFYESQPLYIFIQFCVISFINNLILI